MKKNNQTISKDNNYQTLLQDVQSLISKGKYKAYKAFDNILVQTNWQIGERVVREELKQKDRAGYGKVLIKNLAIDLGIVWQELYKSARFYKQYEIFATVSRKLSWSHYEYLIGINERKERLFYQKKAIANSWSVRELRKQIKSRLYNNTSLQEIEQIVSAKLPATTSDEIFKDALNFDFIQLPVSHKEEELEQKIIQNIKHFLSELGSDFCFAGQQVPINIGGKMHYVDLVLYNKAIPCSVLVDLKVRKFDSADIGQMNKYINYFIENKQYEHEKNTIGLIVCKDANKEEVRYTLGNITNKIFITKYKTKLPSEEKIEEIIHGLSCKI